MNNKIFRISIAHHLSGTTIFERFITPVEMMITQRQAEAIFSTPKEWDIERKQGRVIAKITPEIQYDENSTVLLGFKVYLIASFITSKERYFQLVWQRIHLDIIKHYIQNKIPYYYEARIFNGEKEVIQNPLALIGDEIEEARTVATTIQTRADTITELYRRKRKPFYQIKVVYRVYDDRQDKAYIPEVMWKSVGMYLL